MVVVARRYLIRLPSVMKRVRVMLEWTLDLFFARDAVQLLTIEGIRSGRLGELIDSVQSAAPVETEPSLSR